MLKLSFFVLSPIVPLRRRAAPRHDHATAAAGIVFADCLQLNPMTTIFFLGALNFQALQELDLSACDLFRDAASLAVLPPTLSRLSLPSSMTKDWPSAIAEARSPDLQLNFLRRLEVGAEWDGHHPFWHAPLPCAC